MALFQHCACEHCLEEEDGESFHDDWDDVTDAEDELTESDDSEEHLLGRKTIHRPECDAKSRGAATMINASEIELSIEYAERELRRLATEAQHHADRLGDYRRRAARLADQIATDRQRLAAATTAAARRSAVAES